MDEGSCHARYSASLIFHIVPKRQSGSFDDNNELVYFKRLQEFPQLIDINLLFVATLSIS